MADKQSFSRPLLLKIVAGVSVSVLSALIIAYLTSDKEEPKPEKPGLEKFEDLQGVLSLQYPRFLEKVVYHNVPGSVVVRFGGPPKDFLIVSVKPFKPGDSASTDIAFLEKLLKTEENWFFVEELVTTRRGKPPKKSLYIEKRGRMRLLGLGHYSIGYYELKDGFLVTAVAFLDGGRREEYGAEVDKTFESITLHPDAARRVLLE